MKTKNRTEGAVAPAAAKKPKKEFFFFRSGSVFELICKCLLLVIIPYVLMLIGGLIDQWRFGLPRTKTWDAVVPIAIFFAFAILEAAALVLAVIAIVKYCKKPKSGENVPDRPEESPVRRRWAELKAEKARKTAEAQNAGESGAADPDNSGAADEKQGEE